MELFSKWIKAFFGTSANAAKIQIWIAIIAYLLEAIPKKKLNLPGNHNTILRTLEVNSFKKRPIIQVVSDALQQEHDAGNPNRLKLFNS